MKPTILPVQVKGKPPLKAERTRVTRSSFASQNAEPLAEEAKINASTSLSRSQSASLPDEVAQKLKIKVRRSESTVSDSAAQAGPSKEEEEEDHSFLYTTAIEIPEGALE